MSLWPGCLLNSFAANKVRSARQALASVIATVTTPSRRRDEPVVNAYTRINQPRVRDFSTVRDTSYSAGNRRSPTRVFAPNYTPDVPAREPVALVASDRAVPAGRERPSSARSGANFTRL